MKKYLPYIIVTVAITLVALILFSGNKERELDKRVTLNKRYKIPYGTYVTHELLTSFFASATIEDNKKSPTDWFEEKGSNAQSNLFITITPQFIPTEDELFLLGKFVAQGNQVFIASPNLNDEALKYFGLEMKQGYFYSYIDSPKVYLDKPAFNVNQPYFYPGYSYGTGFNHFDTSKYLVLGSNENGQANFIKVNKGKGSFYLHSDPFMFSNYFLLYGNNKDYFEKSFSSIVPAVKNIMWDEFYLYKLQQEQQDKGQPSPLRVLMSISAFKWAFVLAIILLLLFVLLNMKRKQRIIPIIERPKNESLEFVKVIGRLYFEKKDHLNLAQKMVTFFLEHVRTKYLINTSVLNEEFIKNLSGKSGYEEEGVRNLIRVIEVVSTSYELSQTQLADIYNQFQNFYKQTA